MGCFDALEKGYVSQITIFYMMSKNDIRGPLDNLCYLYIFNTASNGFHWGEYQLH